MQDSERTLEIPSDGRDIDEILKAAHAVYIRACIVKHMVFLQQIWKMKEYKRGHVLQLLDITRAIAAECEKALR